MPLPNRLTNPGRQLRSHYYGGESDTIREIPPEFRAALDLTVLEIPLPWDQEIIPLSDTVLASKGEQKVTSEWMRRTTFKQPGWVTLHEFFTNRYKQIVNRDRTFKTVGDPTSSPGPFTDVKTQNLGNLHFIEDVENAQFLFPNKTTTKEIPDPLPEIFKAVLPMYETKQTMTGIVVDPQILGTGEYYRSETQDDVFNLTRTTRTRTPVGGYPVIINPAEYKLTAEKQVETIVMTLDLGVQTLVPTATMIEGHVQVIGDGTSVKTEGTVPYVFGADEYSISVENLIPPEFRGNIPTILHDYIITGIVNPSPVLTGSEIAHSEKQIDVFNMRVKSTVLGSLTLPITFHNQETTEEYGGGILDVSLTLSNISMGADSGFLVTHSEARQISNTLYLKITKQNLAGAWPILTDVPKYDEETQTLVARETQVMQAPYSPPTPVTGTIETTDAIDMWRTKRTKITKTAPDESNPIITERWRPFQFPGWLAFTGFGWYVRKTRAELCQQIIKTWWVDSPTKPTVAVDAIIMDNPLITELNDTTKLTYAGECLHDDLTIRIIFYPATTPPGTLYAFGTLTGSTFSNLISVYTGGSGYNLGDSITISGGGGSATVTVTAIGIGGSIQGTNPETGSFGWPSGASGPWPASGGAGSGAQFNAIGYNVPTYDSSTRWIGTSRVVAADITPTDIPNRWKIQTVNIVMR